MDKVGYLMDALDEERYIDRRLVIRVDQFTDELLFATPKSLLQIKLWTESWISEDLSCFEGTGTWKDKK